MALLGATRRLLVRIDGDAKGFRKEVQTSLATVDRFNRDIKRMGFELAKMAAIAAGATTALSKLAKRGGEVIQVQTAFSRTGGDVESSLKTMREATLGLISDYDLLQSANNALALGSAETAEEFAELAGTSIRLSRALGVDQQRALESLTLGIARQSRKILDNIGIIVSAEEANQRYAESVNKSASALSEQEKTIAFRQEALRQANEMVRRFGVEEETAADSAIRLDATLKNVLDRWGEIVAESPRVEEAFNRIAAAFQLVSDVAERMVLGLTSEQFEVLQEVRVESDVDRVREISDVHFSALQQKRRDLTEARATLAEQPDNLFVNARVQGLEAQEERLQTLVGLIGERIRELSDSMADVPDGAGDAADGIKTLAQRMHELGGIEALPERLGFDRSIEADFDRQVKSLGEVASNLPQGNLLKQFGGRLDQLAPDEIVIMDVGALTFDEPPEIDFGAGTGAENLFDDAGGFLRDNLDPTAILSGAASNLLSGGISTVISGLSGVFSSIFGGESPEQAQARRIREENTKALERLNQGIARLGDELFGERGGDVGGLRDLLAGIRFVEGPGSFTAFQDKFEKILAELGLTFEDAKRIAETFKIELDGSVDSVLKFRDALRSDFLDQIVNDFGTRFGLIQQRFDLLDIEDPQERIDDILGLLADQLPTRLFAQLNGAIAFGDLDKFIADFFDKLLAGDEAIFDMLGDLSVDDFLSVLGLLEGEFDSLSDEVGKTTDAFRNVPSVFKTAGRIFDASAPDAFRDPNTGQLFGGGGVNFNGPVNIVANDPKELWRQLEREKRKRERQGGARTFNSAFTSRPGAV